MNKRYQLWHHFGDKGGDVQKLCYDVDTVAEALSLSRQLRHGCFDLFSLFDMHGDPREDLWAIRMEPQPAETSLAEDCLSIAELANDMDKAREADREYGKKLDAWWDDITSRNLLRPAPTNPATISLLDSISEEMIKASFSAINHD